MLAGALAWPVFLVAQSTRQRPIPEFRSDVERVQVDVRVLDDRNEPIAGLTQDLFQVLDDGVLQDIDSFAAIDLPRTTPRADFPQPPVIRADAASNLREAAEGTIGVAYLVVVDDGNIYRGNTPIVRNMLGNFVDRHLGPNDRAAFVSTGKSRVFQDFTADKNLLVAAASRVFGESSGSPTVQWLTSIEHKSMVSSVGGNNPVSAPVGALERTISAARDARSLLAEAVVAMRSVGPRSPAILLVTEGSPIPSVTDLGRFTFFNQATGASESLHSSVPIYPIDPRGLTSLGDQSIEIGPLTASDVPPYAALGNEIAASRERMYSLAEDTGGFVIAHNNLDAGLERIARVSGTYYSIGYYAKNAQRDGKYHRIDVKVNRPDVRVVARRGYVSSREPNERSEGRPEMAGPTLKDVLDATFPATDIPLSVAATAFRSGRESSVAIVVETGPVDGAGLELALVAIDGHGNTKARDQKKFDWDAGSPAAARVREQGVRWLSRLNLKPGQYQIRVAGAVPGPDRGSVRLDIDVPAFADGELSVSGVVLSSSQRSETPTFKPDPLLADKLPGPPTATRSFAKGDAVTAVAEVYDNRLSQRQDVEVSVSLASADGRPLLSRTQTHDAAELQKTRGVVRMRTSFTVPMVPSGPYVLTVRAGRPGSASTAVARQVPFDISE